MLTPTMVFSLKSPLLADDAAACSRFWLTLAVIVAARLEVTSPELLKLCANAAGVTAVSKDVATIRAVVFGEIIVLFPIRYFL
jgi:hypothetical protein